MGCSAVEELHELGGMGFERLWHLQGIKGLMKETIEMYCGKCRIGSWPLLL